MCSSDLPSLDLVLQANKYGNDLGFNEEDAKTEIRSALTKLDVFRRAMELDAIRGKGLQSKDDQIVFQKKLMDYKRLQGALRPEIRDQP